MRTLLTTLTLCLAVATSAAAQQVHVVDAGGAGDFTTIQDAIDAASPDDIVYIRAGSYAGATLSGKPLALVGEPDALVEVHSQLFIEGLPQHTTTLVSGLDIHGPDGESDAALRAEHCAGTLWVQSCELRGSHAGPGFADFGVHLIDCADVVLMRIVARGGNHASFPQHQGRSGMFATDSRIWTFESEFRGTSGGFEDDVGGLGGSGVELHQGSEMFSAYGEFHGGVGGGADDDFNMSCSCIICGVPGMGGSGIAFHQGSHATLHRAEFHPASGGPSVSAAGCPDGPAGESLFLLGGSSASMLGGVPRGLRVSPVAFEGSSFQMTFFGAPGEVAWVVAGLDVRPNYLPTKLAPLLVQTPFVVAKPFGVVPAAGFQQLNPTTPALPAGLEGVVVTLQAYFAPSGQLSNGTSTVILADGI